MFWNQSSQPQANLTEKLAQGLQKKWPNAQFKAASNNDPVESIIVPLTNEPPHEPQGASAFIKLSLASSGYAAMKKMNDPDLKESRDTFNAFDYLQFYSPLPIDSLRSDTLSDVALLIERINGRLPLIGFNLQGADHSSDHSKVTYRHMMLFEQPQVNLRLVNRSLTLIIFLINEFLPAIHAVATGEKQLSEIDV